MDALESCPIFENKRKLIKGQQISLIVFHKEMDGVMDDFLI